MRACRLARRRARTRATTRGSRQWRARPPGCILAQCSPIPSVAAPSSPPRLPGAAPLLPADALRHARGDVLAALVRRQRRQGGLAGDRFRGPLRVATAVRRLRRRGGARRPVAMRPARPAVRFHSSRTVDFVVVGSGAAGGIIAKELATAGLTVVVLEQGPRVEPPQFEHDEIKTLFQGALQINPTGFTFRRSESETAKPGQIQLLYHRLVGGGSVMFTANYWRFREIDFIEKSRLGAISGTGLEDWPITYRDLEPYYTKAEWELGISGEPGPFDPPRTRPYPLPPLPVKSSGVLFERGARALANSSGVVGKYLMFNGYSSASGVFERPLNEFKSVTATRVLYDFYESDPKRGFYGGGAPDARSFAYPTIFALGGLPHDAPSWGAGYKRILRDYYTRTMNVDGHSTSLPLETNTISLDPDMKDAWGLPAMRVTYKDHADDLAMMRFLQDRAIEILEAAGARRTWRQPVQETNLAAHLLGTCRMGDDPRTSVVDRYHRAHDVRNLFICDGSSLITGGRGQPTATIQALAYRAGEHIAAFARRGEI